MSNERNSQPSNDKDSKSSSEHNELDAFRIDVSHQEMAMIMLEMEKFCATCPEVFCGAVTESCVRVSFG